MRKLVTTAVVGVMVAVFAAPAYAKGAFPDGANLSGPGIGPPIHFADGEDDFGTPGGDIGVLTGETRIWDALYCEGDCSGARPEGELGPKFTLTWSIQRPIGHQKPFTVIQDIYPYADAGPMTFVHDSGESFLEGDMRINVDSGWFSGEPSLTHNLEFWGMPTMADLGIAPTASGSATAASEAAADSMVPLMFAIALALILVSAAAIRFFTSRHGLARVQPE